MWIKVPILRGSLFDKQIYRLRKDVTQIIDNFKLIPNKKLKFSARIQSFNLDRVPYESENHRDQNQTYHWLLGKHFKVIQKRNSWIQRFAFHLIF